MLYSTLPIIHENRIKTEGDGLHILNWEKPNFFYYFRKNVLTFFKKKIPL